MFSMSAASWVGVRPAAWMSSTSGVEIRPSGRTGTVVESYEYTEYGETTIYDNSGFVIPNSQFSNSFGFTGRRLDTESGLYYYRMRYYDAERGRFLQRDPLGYVDGMGLYAYVGNNPINFIDPLGLEKSTASNTIQYTVSDVLHSTVDFYQLAFFIE